MKTSKLSVLDMVYISMGTALIAVCSWISIPAAVPFTMQTFAVFAILGLLGGKRGTISVFIYILLGAVGVPVFAGFTGGIGKLLGTTGGYILGFILSALLYWLLTSLISDRLWIKVTAMVLGLLVCYIFGTAWFMVVYSRTKGTIELAKALSLCIYPFIIPDAIKIALAAVITTTCKRFVKTNN